MLLLTWLSIKVKYSQTCYNNSKAIDTTCSLPELQVAQMVKPCCW